MPAFVNRSLLLIRFHELLFYVRNAWAKYILVYSIFTLAESAAVEVEPAAAAAAAVEAAAAAQAEGRVLRTLPRRHGCSVCVRIFVCRREGHGYQT